MKDIVSKFLRKPVTFGDLMLFSLFLGIFREIF